MSPPSLEDVLARHGAALRRVCRTYERDPARQEELLQDVLVALVSALPGFRGDASERTFVFRVAHNVGLSHAARRRRRVPRGGSDPDEQVSGAAAPDELVAGARQRARLWAAVLELELADRQLVVLWLEDVTTREIAEISGLSPTHVTTRLSRLRKRLARTLEGSHGR